MASIRICCEEASGVAAVPDLERVMMAYIFFSILGVSSFGDTYAEMPFYLVKPYLWFRRGIQSSTVYAASWTDVVVWPSKH
jgi:hypothetical protein